MLEPVVDRIREAQPRLLAWDRAALKVIKDPTRPLAVVSDLGVPHGGMEKDSAVCRIADGQRSFVVKRHLDPILFRREAANLTFVHEAGGFAPQVVWSDPQTGVLLMEDLGDRSLAWVWKRGEMDEYERWVHRAVEVVLSVQAHFHRHEARLRALYGDLSPDSPPRALSAEEMASQLDEALQISRGVALPEQDRAALLSLADSMNERLARFDEAHREFCLGLSPWHVFEKDGRIRVIDLTFPPIGSPLGQLANLTWHLEDERDILRFYLRRRDELRLPHIDPDEFLLLNDWLGIAGCILWIRLYCRDILEGDHTLVGLDGQRLTDYLANETANLNAIHRALAPHPDLRILRDILTRHFALPL